LLPQEIRRRAKQPYRAPDALAFTGPSAKEWVAEVASDASLADAGIFEPAAARALLAKCAARAGSGQFSNSDNMAVTGVLSTQLVYEQFIRRQPAAEAPRQIRTIVDRVTAGAGTF
jgi:asparagine synthase (glutamine-hydrolysing)